MLYRCFLALFVCIIFHFNSYSQITNEIFCRVIDFENKQPIAYATIQFENTGTGIIANIDGDFRIPSRIKSENIMLIISSIGYETKKIPAISLNDKSTNTINLKPKVELLDQVVLSGKKKSTQKLSARDIVRKAINNIPNNYPTNPFSYVGYYRDYQVIDNKYYNLNEGIVEVFDNGFFSNKLRHHKNNTALYSYKPNKEFSQDISLANSVYNNSKWMKDAKMGNSFNNELTILNIHNVIRNYKDNSFSFVDVFKDNFISNHVFDKEKTLYLDDEIIYKINFFVKEIISNKNYSARGSIFISKEDFSIHRFKYKLYQIKDNTTHRFKYKPNQVRDNSTIFEVEIQYKRYEDKMFLNYITFNNNFYVVADKDNFKVTDVVYDDEKNFFLFTFNKSIDPESIKRRNSIKLYYENREVLTNLIKLDKPNVLKLHVSEKGILTLKNSNSQEASIYKIRNAKPKKSVSLQEDKFSYKIRNIKDVAGFIINKKSRIGGYQFRELFVQSVFPGKKPDKNLFFTKKYRPLKEALLNDFNIDDYWLNSPLKTTDN